ncbi:hypothetical protein AMTRI_Chr04g246260 [Amborella trichopoda]
MDLFIQWNIENKLLNVTLDNASYNDVVVSSLVTQLSRKTALMLDGKMFHVQDVIGVIQEIIDKI